MISNKIRIIEGTNININTEYMFQKNKFSSSLNQVDTKFQDTSQNDARSHINVSSGDDKSRTMLQVLIPVNSEQKEAKTAPGEKNEDIGKDQNAVQTIVTKWINQDIYAI